ncbi:putative Ig domain-containing protein [Catenovulum sediminis]|nr:putative Ig domain-containing protein [Catenovulum sediminis]
MKINNLPMYFLLRAIVGIYIYLQTICVQAASAGLPVTEDFTNLDLLDPDKTSLEWSSASSQLTLPVVDPSFLNLTAILADGESIGSENDWTPGVAYGDIDNDGDIDLIYANRGQANQLYLNDGDGGFSSTAISVAEESVNSQSIVLADFDGDGYLDLAVGNYEEPNKIHLNDGNGNFDSFGTTLGPHSPPFVYGNYATTQIVTADIDNDGDIDILTANNGLQGNYGEPNRIFFNDGTGQFSAGTNISSDMQNSFGLLLADLDNDGDLDVVVANLSLNGADKIYFNDGSGNFPTSYTLSAETNDTYAYVAGDIDNDGDLDLINARQGTNNIYLNDGTGNFSLLGSVSADSLSTRALALADINNNGILDLAVANYQHSLQYFMGDGAGNFLLDSDIGSDAYATMDVALLDIDNDGDKDVVTANTSGNPNRLYRNSVAGGWPKTGVDITGTENLNTIVIGDVNSDFSPDIIVAKSGEGIYLHLNDGLGKMLSGVLLGTNVPNSMTLADINHDGFKDLVCANEAAANTYYLNDQTGGFLAPVSFASEAGNTVEILVTDVNLDGLNDIVAIENSASDLLYLNEGNGVFSASQIFSNQTDDTETALLADLDGDGLKDLVVVNDTVTSKIYFNSSLGNFIEPGVEFTTAGLDVNSADYGDLDGDNDVDLIFSLQNGEIQIYLNDGFGVLSLQGTSYGAGTGQTYTSKLLDLDNDGDLDLVCGKALQNLVFYNDGSANFSIAEVLDWQSTQTSVLDFADFDANGSLDLLFSYGGLSSQILFNKHPGHFSQSSSVISANTDNSRDARVADFNQDGWPDLLIANDEQAVKIYLNDGIGQLLATATEIGGSSSEKIQEVRVADMDNDGDPDIVTATYNQTNKIYLNNGDATFAVSTIGNEVDVSWSVDIADFNRDGYMDVVVGTDSGIAQKIYLNNGDGSFPTTGTNLSADTSGATVAASDVNNDGNVDVVVAATQPLLYLGYGDGTFGAATTVAQNNSAATIVSLADLNQDSYPDMVVAYGFSGSLINKLYLNNGSGGFAATGTDFGAFAESTRDIDFVDVDQDGDLDVIFANENAPNRIHFNDGSGSFDSGVALDTNSYATWAIEVADIDFNGVSELIEANLLEESRLRRIEKFLPTQNQATSIKLNSAITDIPRAELTALSTLSAHSEITYLLSNNGGLNWYPIQQAEGFSFPNGSGSDLRWRLEIDSRSTAFSPSVSQLLVDFSNSLPVVTSSPELIAHEGASYSYTLTASDVDTNDTLTFSAVTLPTWLSFDAAAGVLSGTPSFSSYWEDNTVELSVADGTDVVSHRFYVDVNVKPEITSIYFDFAFEDLTYSYTMSATDSNNDTLTYSAITIPSWLTFDAVSRTLSGTPSNDEVGTHNINLRVSDGTLYTEQAFTLTISNVNDAPVITSTEITSGLEDVLYSYTLTASDVDAGDTLNYSATTLPSWLTFNTSTQILSGTPTNDDIGSHSVVLSVTDGNETVNQSFTIVVDNVNDAPVITSTEITSGLEDVLYSYTFTASDVDAGDTLSYSATSLPSWLTFDTGTQVLSGTPTNDNIGSHSVVLSVTDGNETVNQSFTIVVDNVNDAPVITSTEITSGLEDVLYSYTLTANDVDAGDTLSYSATTLPSWLTFNTSTQILSGTPTNDNIGSHSVVLSVTDGNETISQSFAIVVDNVNDAPVITSTEITSSLEDVLYSYTLTASDVDAGDTLVYSATTLPSWLTFDTGTQILSGTPTNDDIGSHSVVLSVTDGTETVSQSFAIVVDNVNDAPVITSTEITSGLEDVLYSYTFTASDVDAGDTLSYSATSLPSWLTFDTGIQVLSGTPTNDDIGSHSVVLAVTDGNETVNQSFTIVVDNVNDAPIITSTEITSGLEDVLYSYTFTANDVDAGDTLSYSATTLPSWLTFDTGIQVLSGTPTNDDIGSHSVVLAVTDGNETVNQSFTIVVDNVNDAPVITSTEITSGLEDVLYSYTLTANDVDAGDTLVYSATTLPSWLTFDTGTQVLSGTPTNDDIGSHSVVLAVTDGNETVSQSFAIQVDNVNDAPVITSTEITSGLEDVLYSYSFTASDVDAGDTLVYSATTLPSWLTFDTGTQILSGTPTNDNIGSHSVVLSVTDGNETVNQSFTIVVDNVNDAPVITSTEITSGLEDVLYSYTLTASDVDVGDTLVYSATTLPSWLTFNTGTQVLSGTPTNDDIGNHSVVLSVTDGNETVNQSFTIVVDNVNDAPVITSTEITSGLEDVLYSYTLTANDVDAGDTLGYSATTLPSWLTFDTGTQILSGTPTNDDIGSHSVVLSVTDGNETVNQSFTIVVDNVNDAPVITSTEITSGLEDVLYSYTLTASDVDVGDTLVYSATTLPSWLTFNTGTQVLSGTPTNDDIGNHSVVLSVTDGNETVNQSFTIVVDNVNDAPVITSTEIISGLEDVLYSYSFTASDVDVGDTLSYSTTTLPSWLTFNTGTQVLSGTPTNDDIGSHSVVLSVTDGTETVSQSFAIVVDNVNDAPVITSTEITSGLEDVLYSYSFTANDVDAGDTLSYAATTLPSWLTFDTGTQVLSGTPTNDDIGSHSVVLAVTDGTETVSQSFTIVVDNVNDAPVITSTEITSGLEDVLYSYSFTANDVDAGDTLSYAATTLPSWLTFDTGTQILSGTPTNDDIGSHSVVLSVTDGTETVSQSFAIVVDNVNDAPVITSTEITSGLEDVLYSYSFTANDVDAGDTLSYAATTLPSWLTFDTGTQVLSGTPTNDDIGSHSVVLAVTDGNETVSQSFTIVVDNVNDAPVITSTEITSGLEDVLYSYTLTASDVDAGDTLGYSATTLPSWLTFDTGTQILSGTPTNDNIGSHSVVLSVTDGNETVNQSFTVVVDNVNDAPVITSTEIISGLEDVLYSYTFTASDVDAGDTLNYSATTLPSWLTFNTGTQILSGTPTNDNIGSHSVVLLVTDGNEAVNQSFTIVVDNVNDAPVITSTEITSGLEDVLYSYTFTANDVDAGDTLSYSAQAIPTWLTFNTGTQILSGTPTNDDIGSHSVVLLVTDGNETVNQSFTIVVDNVNDAPVITSTEITSGLEDVLYSYTFTASDVDTGDTLSYSATSLPSWLTFNTSTQILSGTPTNDNIGSHSVVLAVTDGNEIISQQFEITVLDLNAPQVVELLPANNEAFMPTSGLVFDVIFNEPVQVASPAEIAIGIVDIETAEVIENLAPDAINITESQLTLALQSTLLPNTQYQIVFSEGLLTDLSNNPFDSASIEWKFSTVNNLTLANDDNAETIEDNAVQINVLANDTDSDGLIVASSTTVIEQPQHGSVSVNTANGVLTYIPVLNFNGTDSFVYQVSDTQGEGSNPAIVTINVLPANDSPILTADQISINEDAETLIDVLANDYDIDEGDEINAETLDIVNPAQQGTVSIQSGEIHYIPLENYVGTDVFSYHVADQQGDYGNPVSVIINVQGLNDAPTAVDDEATTLEDQSVVIQLIVNDSDIEDSELSPFNISIFAKPAFGSVSQTPDGLWSYTPNANFNGRDHFQYILTDSEGASSSSATVNIEVQAVADAPVTLPDQVLLLEDAIQAINVLGNDSDLENDIDVNSIEIIENSEFGQLETTDSGMVIYRPRQNYFGSDSFTYQVSDSTGLTSNISLVSISVTSVNDIPVANADSYQTNEDTVIELDILSNDQDIDGTLDEGSIVLASEPGKGTLEIQSNGIVIYRPTENENGADSFSYQVADNQGALSDETVVSIQIVAVNDLPKIESQPVESVFEDELYQYEIELSDIENSELQLSANVPDWLTLEKISEVAYVLQGTPTEALAGIHAVELIVTDDDNGVISQSYSIDVISVNDAPVINQGESLLLSTIEDQNISRKLSATDTDSQTFSWRIVNAPSFGIATVTQGLVNYQPLANSEASDSFVVELSDGELTDVITVEVDVIAQNDAPQIITESGTSPAVTTIEINEDQSVKYPLRAFDPDNTELVWSIDGLNSAALVSIENGILDYQPVANFFGQDRILVTLSDGLLTDSLLFNINVISVNDAPVIELEEPIRLTGVEDQKTSMVLSATDNDLDTLSWTVSTPPILAM